MTNITHNNILNFKTLLIVLLMTVMSSAGVVSAFDTSVYSPSSVLGSGKWVKISVAESGMHFLSTDNLRRMGFSDPSKVAIFGYGGSRLPEQLSRDSYIDDLPQVQSVATSRGVFFYAVGPVNYSRATGQRYRHSLNPFSEVGYYFVTDSRQSEPQFRTTGHKGAENPVTTFNEVIFHETDITSPGETGHMLTGEDFRLTPTRTFNFNLPGRIEGSKVWAEIAFVACCKGGASSISVTANGTKLPAGTADRIPATTNESYYHGNQVQSQKEFDIEGNKLAIGITYTTSSLATLAALNYITVNYTRALELDSKLNMAFATDDYQLKVSGAGNATRVWDVTNPLDISLIDTSTDNGTVSWTSSYGGRRNYVVWDEQGSFPAPAVVGTVSNQDLHAIAELPDMVIFTMAAWRQQAERLAGIHRSGADSLNVVVLDQSAVFNEFASGVPDVQAFRRCLKMFYDRGAAAGHPLKYALFMGRPTYDNRSLTSSVRALGYQSMPTWQSDGGLSDNSTYTTDDIFAMLRDGSGNTQQSDELCIAVGRLPVTSLSSAKTMVDKIESYINNPPQGQWKSRVMLIADNADSGAHLNYTEDMERLMLQSANGNDMLYTKVYIDAYEKTGDTSEGARTDMYRALNDGVAWWHYIGHGSPTSLSHEKLLTFNDVNNLHLRRLPIMTAMTCDFARWDQTATSAAEIMAKNPTGGVIAAVSATRPTGVYDNGNIAKALARYALENDDNGQILTVGEAMRRAKNSLTGNSNKLRYVLIGDPALRPAIADAKAIVTRINDTDINSSPAPEIKASQNATVDGYIADRSGNTLTDFNGTITTTLYDADVSVTTKGYPNTGKDDGMESVFDRHGSRLYVGSDSVRHGQFRLNIAMPAEISDNYRNATLHLFARSSTHGEAAGVNRSFYVCGFDEISNNDNVAPLIEQFYLNHSSFRSGDKVNESPVAIARISDNRGINLSLAGIGHQMTMWLDGTSRTFGDVADYFTPASDGSSSGTIAYPLTGLADGYHSLRLRVWDTSGNPAEQTINFYVEQGLAAQVFDVFTDANPASVQANFYLSHNRPDAMVTVNIEVFDMMGRMVWTSSQSGQSDLFTSFPITWDLRDTAGRRVGRGIYIYRASMTSTDGTTSNSVAKKIAVGQ